MADDTESETVDCHGVCGLSQSVPQLLHMSGIGRGATHANPRAGLASQLGGRKERKPRINNPRPLAQPAVTARSQS